MALKLLGEVSENTTGLSKFTSGSSYTIYAFADDWGTGSKVKIQSTIDDGEHWIDLKDCDGNIATMTEDVVTNLQPIGSGASIRAVLYDSSGASNITVIAT